MTAVHLYHNNKQTLNTMNTISKLTAFANQRPNLDPHNYGDATSYRREVREITKDLHDFRELLSLAVSRVENLDGKLHDYLTKSSDRLTMENGGLRYIAGQYFPTEYRPAASRALRSIIWDDYRTEKKADGTSVYSDGHEIRKAIKRRVSRRLYNNYFA